VSNTAALSTAKADVAQTKVSAVEML